MAPHTDAEVTRPGLARQIRDLPRAHLHVHFPRTIRRSTLRELAAREGVSLAGFDQFSTLAEFLHNRPMRRFVTRPEDLRRLCREMVEDEARDGVRYTEPMVQLHRYVPRFGSLDEVYQLVQGAFSEAGDELGVEVGIMVGFDRVGDSPAVAEELAHFAARHAGQGVVAFGFGGHEDSVGPEPFARACVIARAGGLLVVPHAGEGGDAAAVARALDALAPDRVAHGVGAAGDDQVMARLVTEGVTCDVCPTSNLRLGVVPGIEDHPVMRMVEAGVAVTLNADCPVDFSVSCSDEYQLIRETFDLSDHEMAAIARASVVAGGASGEAKRRMAGDIDRWLTRTRTFQG